MMPQCAVKYLAFHAIPLEHCALAKGKTAELLSSRGGGLLDFPSCSPHSRSSSPARGVAFRHYWALCNDVMAYRNIIACGPVLARNNPTRDETRIKRPGDIEGTGIPREYLLCAISSHSPTSQYAGERNGTQSAILSGNRGQSDISRPPRMRWGPEGRTRRPLRGDSLC